MNTYSKRIVTILMILTVILSLGGTFAFAAPVDWQEPGNSSLNILNGGVMLTCDDCFYFSENGIYRETVNAVQKLSDDDGANLNLSGGWLWYTLDDGTVRRMPQDGGEAETVFTFEKHIKQMYVVGQTLRFISEGRSFVYDLDSGECQASSALSDIMGLIPTEYGDVYLCGEVFNYSLYAGDSLLLTGVMGAYSDSGYLAVEIDSENYQIELSRLFAGFDSASDLQPFDIHGGEPVVQLFGMDEDGCAVCEANAEVSLLTTLDDIIGAVKDNDNQTQKPLIPEVSQGQRNMVKRARQLHEIVWTPLADRYQWGYRGVFTAGVTITGIPYGQPVNNGGYVGYGVSLDKFAFAVADNTSVFYSGYSTYNKIAPYYSCDCSGFVSYAWGLATKHTTYTWSAIATKVSDQSIYSLQVGDALNHSTSHIVMVSNVGYDSEGKINRVTIMEQTPVKTKLTTYGEGGSYPLSRIQSYYLSGGYAIYRYANRDSVTYSHSCAVPIDGDYCSNCKSPVPKVSVSAAIGSKTVSLSHSYSGAVIYYTLDGTNPTTSSSVYSSPITLTSTATLKAMAVTNLPSGNVLTYKVSIEPAATPTASVESGLASGGYIQSGSRLALKSATSGATLYYTLDGSEPTTASTKYTAPITISSDTTIKVFAQAPGCRNSAVSTISYKIGQVYKISASAGAGGTISPSGERSVIQTGSASFVIKPNNGYAISDVKVDGVSQGKIASYSFTNVSGNHSISASFVVSSSIPFTDVSSSAWYYNAVCYAYSNNLFSGTSGTTFSPENMMTRGMFITVLGRAAGVESFPGNVAVVTGSDVRVRSQANTNCDVVTTVKKKYTAVKVLGSVSSGGYTWYNVETGGKTGYIRGDYISQYSGALTDLPSGQYYSGYVQWAYQCGMLSGMATNTISADSSITREEMALLLYNYSKIYGITLPKKNSAVSFTDSAKVSATAATAVSALQQAGVINGIGDGSFNPKGTATRGAVAQIFMAFKNAV